MADTSVKFFHSGMSGAPTINGTAGSLLAVLDACLVSGFGLKAVESLAVANGIATANISAGHAFEVGTVVENITGAIPAELNGIVKLSGVTQSSISFAINGVADQTATGTISIKMASAGWVKAFASGNVGAYKSADITSTGCVLRVDDSIGKVARLIGYESMSSIDAGAGPFPTPALRTGGVFVTKSNTANSTSQDWMVFADTKMFYFCCAFYSSNYPELYEVSAFGDPIPTKTADPFCCVLSGFSTDRSVNSPITSENYLYSDGNSRAEVYMPRSYTGLATAVAMRKSMASPLTPSSSWYSGAQSGGIPFPNPTDGGVYLAPHYIAEHLNGALRAMSPGCFGVAQMAVNSFVARDQLTSVIGMPGKVFRAVTISTNNGKGVGFFDTTGPWR